MHESFLNTEVLFLMFFFVKSSVLVNFTYRIFVQGSKSISGGSIWQNNSSTVEQIDLRVGSLFNNIISTSFSDQSLRDPNSNSRPMNGNTEPFLYLEVNRKVYLI